VTEGELLTFTATATDAENDEIVFSLDAGAPNGAMIDAGTGVFTWTPTSDQGPGSYHITVRATDLCTSPCSDTEMIEVTVLDTGGGGGDNECPVLNPIGDQTGTQGENLAFTATASDPDPGQLTFSLEGAPTGATIHGVTGAFLWVPTETGSFTFTVKVTDPAGCSDEETIHATVFETGGGGSSTVSAYFVGGDKTTRLWTGKQETCVQLEVTGSAQIDFSTVELVYNGQRIEPREAERSRDRDRDGNREATVLLLEAGSPRALRGPAERRQHGHASDHRTLREWRVLHHGRHPSRRGSRPERERPPEGPAAPNPLNPATVLWFGTTREGSVKVDVFDLSGRLVRSLYEGSMPPGDNSVAWDGTADGGGKVSSGVYYFARELGRRTGRGPSDRAEVASIPRKPVNERRGGPLGAAPLLSGPHAGAGA
jgi:hypothetical protein